jgi:hypothetical protein
MREDYGKLDAVDLSDRRVFMVAKLEEKLRDWLVEPTAKLVAKWRTNRLAPSDQWIDLTRSKPTLTALGSFLRRLFFACPTIPTRC